MGQGLLLKNLTFAPVSVVVLHAISRMRATENEMSLLLLSMGPHLHAAVHSGFAR